MSRLAAHMTLIITPSSALPKFPQGAATFPDAGRPPTALARMGGFAPHPVVVPTAAMDGTSSVSARTASSLSSSSSSLDDGGRGRPPPAGSTLELPSRKHYRYPSRSARLFQKLRRSLPLLTLAPRCGRMQVGSASEVAAAAASGGGGGGAADSHLMSHVVSSFSGAARPMRRVTGTLFGHRKGRVALALQETPRCLPTLVIELAIQTNALLRELANPAGARIVLETERRAPSTDAAAGKHRRAPPLLDVAAWTMFCNGRKTGLAVRREATDDDLAVLETLRPVSMGAGVLPASNRSSSSSSQSPEKGAAAADDEVAYMRGCFDHFVGSRDSESLYMIAPQGGGTGPELAIFFVRL
ncbi:protein MIZU-KUSSEI 1 [Oryza sativa Japonica Group]|nr:protein MIZU-KUSSEI 1 [Oryza sativa Japonica Group]